MDSSNIIYDKPIRVKQDATLGYQYFFDTFHPMANSQGKVYLHRHIAALKVGRWLHEKEQVHHIDGNRSNNIPDNLAILTKSQHTRQHREELGFGTDNVTCPICSKVFTSFKSVRRKGRGKYCSPACANMRKRKTARPSKEELQQEINTTSFLALGRKYGVSDVAVHKWAKAYGIEKQKQKI